MLDCFCGSGTTAAVAEKLKRRWITCDLGRFAIHTARKRLLAIPGVRPFIVQNLGKYERQLWQQEQFRNQESESKGKAKAEARQRDYVHFILGLYQAKPLNGYSWLHGVKGGRMVHVGAVDAPVSVGDVAQIAAEFKRAVGTGKDAPKTNGVDLLGWDFAFEMNEVAKQQAAAANIQLRFLRIPHDAMDKRAVEQGDIHFFELAALSVEAKADVRTRLGKTRRRSGDLHRRYKEYERLGKKHAGGIDVAVSKLSDTLLCQVRVPLRGTAPSPYALNASPGDLIGVGIETRANLASVESIGSILPLHSWRQIRLAVR